MNCERRAPVARLSTFAFPAMRWPSPCLSKLVAGRRGWDAARRCQTPVLLATLLLLSWGSVCELFAQRGRPVLVHRRRDLSAGEVFAGVPKSISRLDPANTGLYRIMGRPDAEISISFTLPSDLLSASGQTMTIDFAADDAGIGYDQNQAASVPFDPQAPLTVRLDADGRIYVWLGGTVRPDAVQAAGYYEATVVLTAAYTGN